MDETMLAGWIGRTEVAHDIADPNRVAGLAALLDHRTPLWRPGVLPPLGHWLCFQPQALQSGIGPDGHPLRDANGLLPTVDLPRRMWAGSRVSFHADIPLGAPIERRSTLVAATPKTGRAGRMLFATVRHEIAVPGAAAAIVEEQDIVYREAAVLGSTAPRAPQPQPPAAEIERGLALDPVMLFRYSALTFNAHRIHYDRDYARDVEGYPGLVVHGPLMATLLLDHLLRARPQARVAGFAFRAVAPLFDGEAVTLGLSTTPHGADLRAIGPAGETMTATATLA